MRAAAIGLIKEAVLEGIDASSSSAAEVGVKNVFASARFMHTFCPILFQPSPPDLFSTNSRLSVNELKESHEASRLADSLALLYVLLQRDRGNRVSMNYYYSFIFNGFSP